MGTIGSVQMGMNLQKMMENQKVGGREPESIRCGESGELKIHAHKKKEIFFCQVKAHQAAVRSRNWASEIQVGLTFVASRYSGGTRGRRAVCGKEWDDEFLHYLLYIEEDDFLGVQGITAVRVSKKTGGWEIRTERNWTQMDYEYYPEALEHVIRKVMKKFKGDLIAENGIATADDTRRTAFIEKALQGVQSRDRRRIP